MSVPPGQLPPDADEAPPSEQPAGVEQELSAWLAWIQQAAEAGGTFAQLLQTEVRLALRSARQLLLLGMLMLPLLLMAWLGMSSAVGWLAFTSSGSVLLGLLAFTAVQLVVLVLLGRKAKILRRRLRLPATKQQIESFMHGASKDGHTPTGR
ncbi:MAG: hypothetical protein EA348_05015 [Pseudomonadaceae bacterium]|nr:MAG: hypothetical protein EA348_05015 [Pseudomonadaceae bacterium]